MISSGIESRTYIHKIKLFAGGLGIVLGIDENTRRLLKISNESSHINGKMGNYACARIYKVLFNRKYQHYMGVECKNVLCLNIHIMWIGVKR